MLTFTRAHKSQVYMHTDTPDSRSRCARWTRPSASLIFVSFHLRMHKCHRHFTGFLASSSLSLSRPSSPAAGPRRGNFPLRAIAILSLICLFALYLMQSSMHGSTSEDSTSLGRKGLSQLSYAFPASKLRNLILVAGHSVYTGTDISKVGPTSPFPLHYTTID